MDLPTAIGLGFDVAGAFMIAFSLLGSPAIFALRGTTFWGANSHLSASEIESRADVDAGMPTLIAGFLGQLIGLGVHSRAPLFVGYLAAAGAVIAPLVVWRLLWRQWRTKRLAVTVARYQIDHVRTLPQMQDLPDLDKLVSLGVGLGERIRDGESDREYLARVFKVTEAREQESD